MRALLLTLALVSAAAAQSAPTITVTDENGVAVSSARVFLQSPPLPRYPLRDQLRRTLPVPFTPRRQLLNSASKKKASTL